MSSKRLGKGINAIINSTSKKGKKTILKLSVGSSVVANNYFWLHGRQPFVENKNLLRELLRIRGKFPINFS